MAKEPNRLLLLTVATVFFVAGFVLNITSTASVYDYNLTQVPIMQQNIQTPALNVFMNIVSNLFSPVICAGYIVIIYVITSRKLEVLIFLAWFVFMSFVISALKMFLQQPRPYWVSTKIQMLEWTCYTEYGNPSGHSSLVIILLDFLVRFSTRKFAFVNKHQIPFYVLAYLLQFLVMFSRVYLGMHTINQVMGGFMIGVYSILPYYMYVEKWLYKLAIKCMSEGKNIKNISTSLFIFLVFFLFQNMVTYLPSYNPQSINNPWSAVMLNIPKCASKVKFQTSFWLKCYEDMAIGFVAPFIYLSLSLTNDGTGFLRRFSYGRCSGKFIAYILVTILFSLIPVAIFLNPLWKKIPMDDGKYGLAPLLYFLNSMGFSIGVLFLVGLSPYVLQRLGLCEYSQPTGYWAIKEEVNQYPKDFIIFEPQMRVTAGETELEARRSALAKSLVVDD